MSDPLDIRQPTDIVFELTILIGLKLGVGDLLLLPTEHVKPLFILLSGDLLVLEHFDLRQPSVIELLIIVERGARGIGAVDEMIDGVVTEERKVIVLPVDIDKRIADFFERRQSYVGAVGDDGVLGGAGDLARDDQGIVIDFDVEVIEDGARLIVRGQ